MKRKKSVNKSLSSEGEKNERYKHDQAELSLNGHRVEGGKSRSTYHGNRQGPESKKKTQGEGKKNTTTLGVWERMDRCVEA